MEGKSCFGCGSCAGCGRTLELTKKEMSFLNTLAQIPFLPVARKADGDRPIYLEEGNAEEMSLLLQCLHRKGLISLDYDRPLKGFDMRAYEAYPVHGSMALTERGQQVLDLMEYQGVRRD